MSYWSIGGIFGVRKTNKNAGRCKLFLNYDFKYLTHFIKTIIEGDFMNETLLTEVSFRCIMYGIKDSECLKKALDYFHITVDQFKEKWHKKLMVPNMTVSIAKQSVWFMLDAFELNSKDVINEDFDRMACDVIDMACVAVQIGRC